MVSVSALIQRLVLTPLLLFCVTDLFVSLLGNLSSNGSGTITSFAGATDSSIDVGFEDESTAKENDGEYDIGATGDFSYGGPNQDIVPESSDSTLLLESGEVKVVVKSDEPPNDDDASQKNNYDYRSFDIRGAVYKGVSLNYFAQYCSDAMVRAGQLGGAYLQYPDTVWCTNYYSKVDGCYKPQPPKFNPNNYVCFFTTINIRGPRAGYLESNYKAAMGDLRFGNIWWNVYNVESREWQVIGNKPEPTRPPQPQPTKRPKPKPTRTPYTDYPTASPSPSTTHIDDDYTCHELQLKCLRDQYDYRCVEYLERNDCAVCNKSNRDPPDVCYKKTGNIYKEAGGHCGLCGPSGGGRKRCLDKPKKKLCKKNYKKCVNNGVIKGCQLFLEINKCSYNSPKKTGRAFTTASGYRTVCGI